MAFLDDDDRESNASSENDQDELMEDADDGDVDMEIDPNEDEDNDEDEVDNEDDDDDDAPNSPSKSQVRRPDLSHTASEDSLRNSAGGPTSHPRGATPPSKPSRQNSASPSTHLYPTIRQEALSASLYDIVPTMAAPQGTSINAITATPDLRYWFSGGSDCYVRKYDGPATINGKTLLTVAQRHPFVDSVTKAGVLMTYWGNEEPKARSINEDADLSPVYSLAVQRDGLWLLSGLESGAINLQSVRHDAGKRMASLEKHTSAVSVLTMAADERSVLSGSWDKSIFDWDLNTGQVRRGFTGTGGQISAIQVRPSSSLPVPEESGHVPMTNGTLASNNASKPAPGAASNGFSGGSGSTAEEEAVEDAAGSPVAEADSLFGDNDSLFGGDDVAAPSGGNFGAEDDDDDEFSKAMNVPIEEQDPSDHLDTQPDASLLEGSDTTVVGDLSDVTASLTEEAKLEESLEEKSEPAQNATATGQPHASEPEADAEPAFPVVDEKPTVQDPAATSDSTFLAASYDGTLLVWDRRQANPVARIPSRTGGPWCMDACWSPDGNSFFAGRRNNTVEEYSLHKGLKEPSRIFKFPNGSGPVSAVRALPNGRHLICASYDILRLYDLENPAASSAANTKHSTVPFLIVPGPPRAGVISALHIDPTCKYMISAAGNRGWEGSTTEVLIGYEIACIA